MLKFEPLLVIFENSFKPLHSPFERIFKCRITLSNLFNAYFVKFTLVQNQSNTYGQSEQTIQWTNQTLKANPKRWKRVNHDCLSFYFTLVEKQARDFLASCQVFSTGLNSTNYNFNFAQNFRRVSELSIYNSKKSSQVEFNATPRTWAHDITRSFDWKTFLFTT